MNHRVRCVPREGGEGGLGGVDSPTLEHIGKQQGFSPAKGGPKLVGGQISAGQDCVAEKVNVGGNLALHCVCNNIDGFVGEKGMKCIKAMVNGNRA